MPAPVPRVVSTLTCQCLALRLRAGVFFCGFAESVWGGSRAIPRPTRTGLGPGRPRLVTGAGRANGIGPRAGRRKGASRGDRVHNGQAAAAGRAAYRSMRRLPATAKAAASAPRATAATPVPRVTDRLRRQPTRRTSPGQGVPVSCRQCRFGGHRCRRWHLDRRNGPIPRHASIIDTHIDIAKHLEVVEIGDGLARG